MTPIHFHQEMYIRDLNSMFEELESTEDVDSAQAAAATSHTDWLDIKSVDVNAPKGLYNPFSLKDYLGYRKKMKARGTFEKYGIRGEPRKRKIDHQTDLIQICRFEISSYSASEATTPRTIPQLNPGPSSGQTNIVRLAS